MSSGLLTELGKNVVFVLQFLGVVAALFIVAYVVEKWEKKPGRGTETEKRRFEPSDGRNRRQGR